MSSRDGADLLPGLPASEPVTDRIGRRPGSRARLVGATADTGRTGMSMRLDCGAGAEGAERLR